MIILQLNPVNNKKVIRLITKFKTQKDVLKANKKINEILKNYIEIPGSANFNFAIYSVSFLKKKESKCKKI
jgi:hypothetical protein